MNGCIQWLREVLVDFHIPFDDHERNIRYSLVFWMKNKTEECNQLRARLSEVEKERDEYKTGMEQARGVAARLASGFQILDLNKVFKLVGSGVEKDVRQAIGWAKKEEKAR